MPICTRFDLSSDHTMIRITFCAIVVLLLDLPISLRAAEEHRHIYLLMGQSNMVGRGELTPWPTHPRVLGFNKAGKWCRRRSENVAPGGEWRPDEKRSAQMITCSGHFRLSENPKSFELACYGGQGCTPIWSSGLRFAVAF